MKEFSHQPRAATGIEYHSAGAVIAAHVHDDDQFLYASNGVLAVETSEGRWAATPERAVHIPAGVWHEHRVFGASTVHVIGVPEPLPRAQRNAPRVVPATGLVRELILNISGELLQGAARGTALALLLQLAAELPSHGLTLPRPSDHRLQRACIYVESHLSESVAIGALSQHVGVSERTLSRLFRSHFGMTYPQWRSVLRTFHASVALAEGLSVTEVAMRCGFPTPAAFAQTFSRLTGHPPGRFARLEYTSLEP
ncbi:AraC family transcriptional regulator [Curtobacterium sp. MWU13-2055]|uniref:helix-turn-helix transcriptional regulator n=1 Tax=Curtobacterium sp. MWU13-2055 TaxID=2931928 RepID=UPI00200C1357|nr:AraC family transcriptional regulator [Curtobacterium sp. MWU13-2055]